MYISPLEHVISAIASTDCQLCNGDGNMLCGSCRQNLYENLDSRCYICNKLVSQHRLCNSCRSRSRLRRVWWLSAYEGVTKSLVANIKLGRNRSYAREFGKILSSELPYLPPETIVVGVPTASRRRRMRGFDQAEVLSMSFAKARSLQHLQPFIRTTQVDQIGKRRSERIDQMNGSFKILHPEKINGASILLIDDVLTTGATLETAAKLLRQNGAKHVDAAVIARHLLG